jgi:hypothetical protein
MLALIEEEGGVAAVMDHPSLMGQSGKDIKLFFHPSLSQL